MNNAQAMTVPQHKWLQTLFFSVQAQVVLNYNVRYTVKQYMSCFIHSFVSFTH